MRVIIPVHTGTTFHQFRHIAVEQVYPHTYGDYILVICAIWLTLGSSLYKWGLHGV